MLASFGFDMSKYVNDLSVIHTVLKRLNEAGETRFVQLDSGKDAYVWTGSMTSWAMNWAGRPAVATALPATPPRPRTRKKR